MMTRCLARYRKEWRYALHLVENESCESETATLKNISPADPFEAQTHETQCSDGDLRGAVGALPTEQRRLIEQLFWEERTEAEVAKRPGSGQVRQDA
jgi:DNA-directed RNA polymerase specialized sigma24 family protein